MKMKKSLMSLALVVVCLFSTSGTALAAERFNAVEYESVDSMDSSATSSAIRESIVAESTAAARSVYGYAAKYTDSARGSFVINAPGSGNSTGYFQITTHDFSGSPVINAVLYRPDGTYANQIYITGNGTKTVSFSNAIPGNYEVVYGVEGNNNKGWVSGWVSSK
ncbi:MAG: hypothetical protein HFJ27_00990 [Clostridia bacterium]|nr:hypothetical protein [Clostridia bacterium]